MKIKCLSPWFGSKRTLAPVIVQQLGPHRAFWEPFCGSMAVLFAKPACSTETVNDLFGDLVNLARVVQSAKWGPWLYRRLRRVLVHESLFDEAIGRLASQAKFPGFDAAALVEDSAALRACDYFVAAWMGRSGMAGTRTSNAGFAKRYTSEGGDMAGRFVAAVDSIPAWRERLRSVCILREDGLELLDKIEDKDGTAIYCDPPYLVKGASYIHDFADADHVRLAEALRRFRRTRIVVSYYADPRLAALYPGWQTIDCARSKHMVSSGRRGGKNGVVAPEVLLVNGEAGGRVETAPAARSLFAE